MLSIAENPMNFTPGAVGFDPLKLYEKQDGKGQRALQLNEVCVCVFVCLCVSTLQLNEVCVCVSFVIILSARG